VHEQLVAPAVGEAGEVGGAGVLGRVSVMATSTCTSGCYVVVLKVP